MNTKETIIAKIKAKREEVIAAGNISYTLKSHSMRDINNESDETKKAIMVEENKKTNNLISLFRFAGGEKDEKLTSARTHERDLWCEQQGFKSRAKIEVFTLEDMVLTVFQRAYNKTAELTFKDLVKEEVRVNVETLVI